MLHSAPHTTRPASFCDHHEQYMTSRALSSPAAPCMQDDHVCSMHAQPLCCLQEWGLGAGGMVGRGQRHGLHQHRKERRCLPTAVPQPLDPHPRPRPHTAPVHRHTGPARLPMAPIAPARLPMARMAPVHLPMAPMAPARLYMATSPAQPPPAPMAMLLGQHTGTMATPGTLLGLLNLSRPINCADVMHTAVNQTSFTSSELSQFSFCSK